MPSSPLPPDNLEPFDEISEEEFEGAPEAMGGIVKRGVRFAGAGYAATQILNLGVYLFLARLLSPSEFGDFAAATAMYGFATLVTEGGMMSALIHRRDRVGEAASTATATTVLGGTALSLLGLASAPIIGAFFNSSEVTTLAAASSGLIFLKTVGVVPMAILQRQFSFLRRLVIEPAQVVVFGITAIICAKSGLGVWSLVIGQYVGNGVDIVLSWLLIRWRPKLGQVSFKMWRELASYGRHVLAATFVLRLGEQSDAVIIGRLISTSALGQFRYAARLAGAPYGAVLSAVSYVLFPAFARISDDKPRFREAFLRSLRWMCAVTFPAGLILIPLGEPLAVILFGNAWRSAGYAAMGLCFYTAGNSISAIASEALKADGKPQPLTKIHAVTTVTTIIAMLALRPLGLPAVAAGVSIGGMLGAAYSINVLHRLIGIPWLDNLKQIWAPALAAVIMALAVLPVELLLVNAESHPVGIGLLLLAAESLLAGVIYLGALFLLSPSLGRDILAAAKSGLARLSQRGKGTPGEALP